MARVWRHRAERGDFAIYQLGNWFFAAFEGRNLCIGATAEQALDYLVSGRAFWPFDGDLAYKDLPDDLARWELHEA